MRIKIIALFSFIVLSVGAVAWVLSFSAAASLTQSDPHQAPRAAAAAVAQLEVEGMATERWLGRRAAEPASREPFQAGTPSGRAEAATSLANKIGEAASDAPELVGVKPSIVALVDASGKVLGRNLSSLMRDQDLAKVYPTLKTSLESGTQTSDVWVNTERNEQMLVSYAPVRGDDGKILGAILFGSELNDGRATTASERTSGHAILVAVKGASGLAVVAKSAGADASITEVLAKPPASEGALQTLATGKSLDLGGFPEGVTAVARVLDGYGDGRQAVVIAVVRPQQKSVAMVLLFPVLGAVLLGIILVCVAGVLMDAYIAKPIAEIEDGLLAIMNGQTNRRLEVEHAELGGVVFRINSLLNQLFGVAEDDTDAEGRPSHAPTAKDFKEALAVDESIAMSGGTDPEESRALHGEDADAYRARVFNEFVAAKRSVGDPTEHINQADFLTKLTESEQEMLQKHGKPVRFKVEVKGKEVVLLAVPVV